MLFLIILAWDADSKLLCLEGLKLLTRHIDRKSKQKRLVKLGQSGKKLDELTSEHHLFKCCVPILDVHHSIGWSLLDFHCVHYLLGEVTSEDHQSLKALFYNNL